MTAAVLFRAARGAREGWGLWRLFRSAARCGFELLRCGAKLGVRSAVEQPVCAPQEAKRVLLAGVSSLVADYASPSDARARPDAPLGQPPNAFGLQGGLRDPSVAAETITLRWTVRLS